MNVIVGECFDGWLSDARALAVRPEHALEAIAGGASPTRPPRARWAPARAPPASASSPASGTSSRAVGGHTLGCLVVSNYGARRDLHLLVGADAERARRPGPEPPAQGGSIMIVLGTDAPLSERQLRRLASRGTFGLGRAGQLRDERERRVRDRVLDRSPRRAPGGARPRRASASCATTRPRVRDLFEAAGEVVQESVLNSLCVADAMEGRDGNRAEAFPHELLDAVPFLRRD